MKIKRIFGLCDCPGCFRISRELLVVKGVNGVKRLHLCRGHAWELGGYRK